MIYVSKERPQTCDNDDEQPPSSFSALFCGIEEEVHELVNGIFYFPARDNHPFRDSLAYRDSWGGLRF